MSLRCPWRAVPRPVRRSDMALPPPLLLLLLLPPLLMALLARAATPPELVQVPTLAPGEPPLPAQSADELFAAGAEAYSRGDWPAVVLQMERALRARAAVRSRLVRCRLRCANATAGSAEGIESQPDPVLRDLLFFRTLLRRAACLRSCGPAAPSRYRLGEEVDREFARRSPYNYLQVAYFKVRHRHRQRGREEKGRGCPATTGFWDGRDARRIPESGGRMDGVGPGEPSGGNRGPRTPGGFGVCPGGMGLPAGSPGLAPPTPFALPPFALPPPVPRRSSAEPPLSPPSIPAAGMPGHGCPLRSAPRGSRAVSLPSYPDEPAGAGGGSRSHILRGQPRAPGDEAEPGVLSGHGGSPRG